MFRWRRWFVARCDVGLLISTTWVDELQGRGTRWLVDNRLAAKALVKSDSPTEQTARFASQVAAFLPALHLRLCVERVPLSRVL